MLSIMYHFEAHAQYALDLFIKATMLSCYPSHRRYLSFHAKCYPSHHAVHYVIKSWITCYVIQAKITISHCMLSKLNVTAKEYSCIYVCGLLVYVKWWFLQHSSQWWYRLDGDDGLDGYNGHDRHDDGDGELSHFHMQLSSTVYVRILMVTMAMVILVCWYAGMQHGDLYKVEGF